MVSRRGRSVSAEVEELLKLYIESERRALPRFKGYEAFQYLMERRIIRESSLIRVMYARGGHDGCYEVNGQGMLGGMELKVYSGVEGVSDPREIFSLEKAPDGWEVDNLQRFLLFDGSVRE